MFVLKHIDAAMDDPQPARCCDAAAPVILIAEDEAGIRNFAQLILEETGYVVLSAANGEEALCLSRTYGGRIHVLLTDIVMPNMGGVELSSTLLAERPGIGVVLMSGHTFAENISQEFPFMQKPFSPRILRETIAALLSGCHGTQS